MLRASFVLFLALALLPLGSAGASEPEPEENPVTSEDAPVEAAPVMKLATFGGGCFWCTEAIYERIEGVESAVSGYSGGHVTNPTYQEITSGTTGHAECVQIRFDPKKVAYLDLLKVFFATHDPTTLNRQGADVGTQYRSVVFWHDEKQKEIAEKLIKELEAAKAYPDPIVTEITKLDVFYPAETYHQEYFERNPRQGYCRVVIAPKVEKFEKAFANLLKKQQEQESQPERQQQPADAE